MDEEANRHTRGTNIRGKTRVRQAVRQAVIRRGSKKHEGVKGM